MGARVSVWRSPTPLLLLLLLLPLLLLPPPLPLLPLLLLLLLPPLLPPLPLRPHERRPPPYSKVAEERERDRSLGRLLAPATGRSVGSKGLPVARCPPTILEKGMSKKGDCVSYHEGVVNGLFGDFLNSYP